MSGVDCTKFLPEFNCGPGTLNPNDTNHNINRDTGEISSQADDSSEDTEMSVICDNFVDEESSCCDVESGVNSLERYAQNRRSLQRACDERTVGTDAYSVTNFSSEIRVGDTVEGERIKEENAEVRWAPEPGIKVEDGCLSDESPSTEEQNEIWSAECIQETDPNNPNLQQLHVSESEGQVHIHIQSSTLNSVEAFNTFQYWRVPIPELEFDFGLAETGKPAAVHMNAKVMNETMQQTFASELNVDMDIDVSSFEILSYIYLVYRSISSIHFCSKQCSSTSLPVVFTFWLHARLAMGIKGVSHERHVKILQCALNIAV